MTNTYKNVTSVDVIENFPGLEWCALGRKLLGHSRQRLIILKLLKI